MKPRADDDDPVTPTDLVQPSLRVLAPSSTRAIRRATYVIAGLIALAILKPWGAAEAPVARPDRRVAVVGTQPPRPPEDPIEAICHSSPSWRVASIGLFFGNPLRESAFVTPVVAAGPSDPSIPFAFFGFSVHALGYCAPNQSEPPIDLDVRVFRLDAAGAGTTVAVARQARTPVTSVAGLFSIVLPAPATSPSPGAEPGESWPPGRYVFALRGGGFGDVWFGAELRTRLGGA